MTPAEAVAFVNVDSADLQRGAPPAPPGGTWCNKFVVRVCAACGVHLPWGEFGRPANRLVVDLREGAAGFVRLANESEACGAAEAGALVVAAAQRLPNGHMAIGLGTGAGGSLLIAQAGAQNFANGRLAEGFGNTDDVEFFANFSTIRTAVVDAPSVTPTGAGVLTAVLLAIGGVIVWILNR